MLLEVASLGRRHLRPTAPEQRPVFLTIPGLSSAGASQKKRDAVMRKESAETAGLCLCQDAECGARFGWVARTLWSNVHVRQEVQWPHTTNLCRNCFDHRSTESCESKVTSAVWKDMIRQKVSRGRLSAGGSHGFIKKKKKVKNESRPKKGGQIICWKRKQRRCSWQQVDAGKVISK